MKLSGGDLLHDPGALRAQILGRDVTFHSTVPPEDLEASVEILEESFRAMEQAYGVRWGCPPSALDTSTWLLMGALNLAHRLVSLEREANRQTQDLEQSLSKLLDDVPDDTPTTPPLFVENS